MVAALLVISFALLLAAAASYAYQRRYSSNVDAAPSLPPPREAAGLFNNPDALRALAQTEACHAEAARRQHIMAQAANGVTSAALDAWAEHDANFYQLVCDALVNQASLIALADFWAQHETLPVPIALLAKLRETHDEVLTVPQCTQWFHLAARTGDAETFRSTLAQVRARRPSQLSKDALGSLAVSAYWLLPAQARNSGASFVLRRELEQLEVHR